MEPIVSLLARDVSQMVLAMQLTVGVGFNVVTEILKTKMRKCKTIKQVSVS